LTMDLGSILRQLHMLESFVLHLILHFRKRSTRLIEIAQGLEPGGMLLCCVQQHALLAQTCHASAGPTITLTVLVAHLSCLLDLLQTLSSMERNVYAWGEPSMGLK